MKKTLSVILVAIMLATSIATMAVGAASTPSEWDGTTKDTSWYDVNSTTKTATLYNAAQLAGFAEISKTETFVDWTIKLGTDIVWNKGDAATFEATAPANIWTPVADFWGTFDGQGHTVSGLYFNDDTVKQVGFFASLNGGVVKNLSVVNSYFCGRTAIGGIAGEAHDYYVVIENCYSDVILHGYPMQKDKTKKDIDRAQIGGILGLNSIKGTTVSNCWSEGKYIAYAPWDGMLENDGSDNKATVVGGIVGISQIADIAVKDCISSAYIQGHSQLGGIIGRIGGSANSSMENCIFLGSIHVTRERDITSTGPASNVAIFTGSILGVTMGNQVAIKNCYALDTHAVTYMKESIVNPNFKTAFWSSNNDKGKTSPDSSMFSITAESIKGDAAKTTLAGFDFTNVWAAGENGPEIASLSYIAQNKVSNVPADVPSDEPEQGGEVTPPVGGDDNTDDPADTGNANTEPVDTNEVDTNTETQGTVDTTKPADTEEEKSGCGAALGTATFAVLAIASAAAFVGKKKED